MPPSDDGDGDEVVVEEDVVVDPDALPPLFTPSELAEYPGAPFSAELVEDASAGIRAEAGWHIAPLVEQTLLLDCDGGTLLELPTMRLVEVLSVRDLSDADSPRTIDGWRKTAKGQLYRRGGWPSAGFEAVEVTIRHGYDETPRDLRSVVAERCQFAAVNTVVRQESSTSKSVTFGNDRAFDAIDRRVARYRVVTGP